MGRRGPQPKPTALKRKAGNPGRRKLDEREWAPPAGAPQAPEFLSENREAMEVWKQLVEVLAAAGLATVADGHVLARYCELTIRWREAAAAVRARGLIEEIRSAPSKKNPAGRMLGHRVNAAAKELRDLHKALLLVEREFGLTPAARSRIIIETQKKTHGGDLGELRSKHFNLRLTGDAAKRRGA